jgi:hypothetical protein
VSLPVCPVLLLLLLLLLQQTSSCSELICLALCSKG